MELTVDQVAGLAPDASSLKAGRELAVERRWSGLGRDERALWGLCQGSGAKPYQTEVDRSGPAFKCSCPSRKFPCKHALGLLLLAAGSPTAVPAGEQPEWVTEWLGSRGEREDRAKARAESKAAPDPEAQARRAAGREDRVRAGVDELERWLHDLARQGLAQARQRPYGFWDEAAARLVDAQAPALAGRVREMGGIAVAGGDRWADDVLEEAGLIQLLLRAYHRLDHLPPDLQADVRALIGWTVSQEEVTAGEKVRDRWAVVGRVVEDDDRLRVQRVWLRGLATGRDALILSFAAGMQPLDTSFAVATVVDVSLSFYPGAAPLRALLAEQHGAPEPLEGVPGGSVRDALDARAATLARQPWAWRLPVSLAAVVPVAENGHWLAAEPSGAAVELACADADAWRLAALAGGRPVSLFGEWRRERVRPVSAHAEGRFVHL